jgi:phosphoenolpyruvate carboxylase
MYMRAFIARSDPALNAGLIPAVISAKVAISEYNQFENKTGIEMFPWLGGGSLPFRGNVSPNRIDESINEYRGLSSITVQSSFRYDHPLNTVKNAIKKLNQELPKNQQSFMHFSTEDIKKTAEINAICKNVYCKTIESIAHIINKVAIHIPARRERMLHIGLFGYSRGMGKVTLPRAIRFTGSLYSLGVPPEIIGTGRALRILKKKGLLEFVENRYSNLVKDLQFAYGYLNKENVTELAKYDSAWTAVQEDVLGIEEYLEGQSGVYTTDHLLHRNEVSSVYHLMKEGRDFSKPLLNAATIRKSLG